jgi:hypothetical protein
VLQDNTSGEDQAQLSALLAQQSANDPELARLLDAWPALPLHIKAAIQALIETVR